MAGAGTAGMRSPQSARESDLLQAPLYTQVYNERIARRTRPVSVPARCASAEARAAQATIELAPYTPPDSRRLRGTLRRTAPSGAP